MIAGQPSSRSSDMQSPAWVRQSVQMGIKCEIVFEPQGSGSLGFDPIFYVNGKEPG